MPHDHKPDRIDLRVILGSALETDELSLEHDTLVVSLELKRRVAEQVRAATEKPSADEPGEGGPPRRS